MRSKIREARSDRLFNLVNFIILTVFFLTVLYPIVYIVSASFSSANAIVSGRVFLWPVEFGLQGYKAVFDSKLIWTGFGNSLFYTAVGTTLSVFLTIAAAYPLSRKDFVGRNVFMLIFIFTVMFSGGMIPTYMVVKDLGILHTRWAMIFPAAMSVFNVIITRTYFQANVPHEMLEAARMDGCNDLTFLRRIVIPLSGPIVAVITLFYAVHNWNSYFDALLYLDKQRMFPLQLILRSILIQNQVDPSMIVNEEDMLARQSLADLLKYSLIIVASIPILLIYPFIQKYFVKGVMIGSIKG